MTSSSVNPLQTTRLSKAIDIEFDFLRLNPATPVPFHAQAYEIDSTYFQIPFILQSRRPAPLNQFHFTGASVDFCLLCLVGNYRRRLDFRHPIRQNLAHSIFVLTEGGCVQTILDRAGEHDHSHAENRHAQEDLVEREGSRQTFSAPHNIPVLAGP